MTGSLRGGGAALALALAACPAAAQEGGPRLEGLITQSFEADSNFDLDPDSDGTTLISATTLGVDFVDETRTQSFRLSTETTLRIGRFPDEGDDDTEVEVTLPALGLDYTRTGARSALTLGARYARTPVEFLRDIEPVFDDDGVLVPPDDLDDFEGTGTRTTAGAETLLTFGIDTPAEWRLGAGWDRVTYSGTDDPDLNDTEQVTAEAGVRLALTPVLAGDISLQGRRFRAEDDEETERDEIDLRFGLDYAASPVLTLRAGAGYSWEEITEDGDSRRNEGLRADIGFDYTLPRGSLAATLGVEDTEGEGLVLFGAAAWTRDLPRGSLTAALDRAVSVDDEGEVVVVTAARADYAYEINTISAASLGLSWSMSDNLDDAGDPDISRWTLEAGYSRQLTERLSLDLGYAWRHEDEEGGDSAQSHAVSLGLSAPFRF